MPQSLTFLSCPLQVGGEEGEKVSQHAPNPNEQEHHRDGKDLAVNHTRNSAHVFIEQSVLLWVPLSVQSEGREGCASDMRGVWR